MKLREVNDHTLRDVSVKQCYEWIKTGKWKFFHYLKWLKAKGINSDREVFVSGRFPNPVLVHTPNASLSYEWIKTGFWGRRKFNSWLSLKFFWEL